MTLGSRGARGTLCGIKVEKKGPKKRFHQKTLKSLL
jgi:hypothetical protein